MKVSTVLCFLSLLEILEQRLKKIEEKLWENERAGYTAERARWDGIIREIREDLKIRKDLVRGS